MKRCTWCGETKPLDEFSLRNGRPHSWCKACVRQRGAEHYEKNKEKRAAQHAAWWEANREKQRAYSRQWCEANPRKTMNMRLKKRYGITLDQYEELLAAQGGVCAICGATKTQKGSFFAVDHDHNDGHVRGLLCHNCNVGIGMLGDDLDRLRAAVTYIEGASSRSPR